MNLIHTGRRTRRYIKTRLSPQPRLHVTLVSGFTRIPNGLRRTLSLQR